MDDSHTFHVFIYLLLNANYVEGKYHGYDIKRGDVIISLEKTAADLGLSVRNVRTALNHLKSTSEVTIKATNRFTIVTICNYEHWQDKEEQGDMQSDMQSDKQLTNNRQTTDKHLLLYKEINKEKENIIYAEAELLRERDSLLKQVEEQSRAMEAMQQRIDELMATQQRSEEEQTKKSTNDYPMEFEEDYKLYQRKGSKKRAYDRWKKLSEADKEKMRRHIPIYWQSNSRQYLKDFEGYINQRTFDTPITGRDGSIIYDPDMFVGQTYTPNGYGIVYNETRKVFMYLSMYDDGDPIFDGYTDENRPDKAIMELNNARGTIIWSKEQQKWNRL